MLVSSTISSTVENTTQLILTLLKKNESPRPWQWAFQTPSSTQMEGLYDLYLDVMMVLVGVGAFVTYLFLAAITSWFFEKLISNFGGKSAAAKRSISEIMEESDAENYKVTTRTLRTILANRNQLQAILAKSSPVVYYSHHSTVEFLWTVFPCVLLLLIAIPSFTLVLAMDEDFRPWLWLKVIGNQWYWTYECSTYSTNLKLVQYDSVMVPTADLKHKYLRLLVADTKVTIPYKRPTRFLVTSNDVIHSWAVPALGVKIDACPGRINSVTVIPTRLGIFYGQCSEICGVNHAFMPIVVQVVI